jgi:hypothetical protein
MAEVNMSINDGQAFFAHETSVNFNPGQVILDFKSITPRIDPRNKNGPTFVLAHNTILVDPFHAKQLQKIIAEAIKRYEQEFGKIEKTKAMQKAERKQKIQKEEAPVIPHYMG